MEYIVYYGTPTNVLGQEQFSTEDAAADFYYEMTLKGYEVQIVEVEIDHDDIITQCLLRTEGLLAAREDRPKQVAPKRRPVSI